MTDKPSRFKIKKLPPTIDYDVTSIEFFDFVPDSEHLKELSGDSYSLSDGANLVPFDEDACEDDLQQLLETLDAHDPGAIDSIADKLEDIGYYNAGNMCIVDIIKEKKLSEYILYLELDDHDNIFVIAQCTKKSVLEKYLTLLDQSAMEFKIKLIVAADPDKKIRLSEFMYSLKNGLGDI